MRLTSRNLMEVSQMQIRITYLHSQAFHEYLLTYDAFVSYHQDELTNYKIKLENLYSETDVKEMSSE